MWDNLRRQPMTFLLAFVLHLGLVLAMWFGYHPDTPVVLSEQQPVIQAFVIGGPGPAMPVEPVADPEPAVQPLPEPPKSREEVSQHVVEEKQPPERELLTKNQLELKRKMDEVARQDAERKRISDEAESKRKAEEEQRRLAEERRKAEELKRRQEDDRRKAVEDELRHSMEDESRQMQQAAERQRAAERQQLVNRELAKYTGLISQKVERNWVRPSDSPKGFSCIARVQLMPGGAVARASIVKSCGNVLLDRSVEAAIYKSSPLPVPSDPDIFNSFRDIQFKFEPR